MHIRRAIISLCGGIALCAVPIAARTIRVPEDYATITKAVAASRDGDIVEVDDGFYFERNIVIDKKISLRSRRPYGAVVSSSGDMTSSVFIVRAECEISGFIIKNAYTGILQRDSPDVRWTGRDLAIFDCPSGIDVNDRLKNIGSARLRNIIIDRSTNGISTNDAGELEAENLFVSRCITGFAGSNHVRFFVDNAVLWNNQFHFSEGVFLTPAWVFSTITTGKSIFECSPRNSPTRLKQMEEVLDGLFIPDGDPVLEKETKAKRLAIVHMILGETYLDLGDWRAAAGAFRKAAAPGQDGLPAEIRWRIDLGLGRAAEGAGDREGAVGFYKRALADIDRISRTLPISALMADFRSDKIDVYESLIGLLLEPGENEPDGGRIAEALDYAEQAKARSLLLDMPATQGGPEPADPAVRKEEDRLAFRLTRCQVELQDRRLEPEKRSALLDKLRRLEADREEFSLRTASAAGKNNRRGGAPSASLEMIRRDLLRPGEALVEYFAGTKSSYAFLVTKDDIEAASLPGIDRLTDLVHGYLGFVSAKDAPEFKAWEGGHRLWRILLGPFADRLSNGFHSLIIVPDGPLAGLPFEALVTDSARKRFVLEDFSLRYALSAAILARIRAKGPLPAKPKDFLGIAQPAAASITDLSNGRRIHFSALPFARREIQEIAGLFSPGRTSVLSGRRGGEAELKAAHLVDFRFIHFAVHNWIDERSWRRNFLLLGLDETGTEDGFLQPDEVRRLRLDAELVVLAGCETAHGFEQRGEGRRGISSAFFRAGARGVLISHWAIDDAASAEFMTAFYRGLLAGKSRAGALRETKLSFLRSKRGHPVSWAQFILIG